MKRQDYLHLNNKGVTLIELIVAIAMMSIVSVIMISFLTLGVNQYRRQTEDISIQRNTQMLQTQLRDVLSDANRRIYAASATDPASDRSILSKFRLNGKDADSALVILNSQLNYNSSSSVVNKYNIENGTYYVSGYFIAFFREDGSDTGRVYYHEVSSKDIRSQEYPEGKAYGFSTLEEEILDALILDTGFNTDCAKWPRLAEHVKDLTFTLIEDPIENHEYEIDRVDTNILFRLGDRERNVEHSVALRNKVYHFPDNNPADTSGQGDEGGDGSD